MKNKTNYNKLLNLSHKTDYYLTNSYEDNFENQNNEWNNDEILNLEDNIPKQVINNIKTFYFRGKMNYQELSLKDKILMTGLRVSISNKKQSDISNDEKMILEVIDKPIDYIDKKSIDILLNNVSSNG